MTTQNISNYNINDKTSNFKESFIRTKRDELYNKYSWAKWALGAACILALPLGAIMTIGYAVTIRLMAQNEFKHVLSAERVSLLKSGNYSKLRSCFIKTEKHGIFSEKNMRPVRLRMSFRAMDDASKQWGDFKMNVKAQSQKPTATESDNETSAEELRSM